MARIAVLTSHPPFAEGGHLVIAHGLVEALRSAGHHAMVVLTPQNRFGRQASAYLATWLTDIGISYDGKPIDQVISLRYPSYAIRHPNHVCWLNHRMREYYDQWESFRERLSWKGLLKERVRRSLVHAVDRQLLTRNVHRLFTQSKTIQARLVRWGKIPSEVLYPPPPSRRYHCDSFGDYLFVVSRLTALKRVDLVIEALRRPEAAGIHCVIAGDGEFRSVLAERVLTYGLSDRVKLVGLINDDELVNHLGRCRAVCFPPYSEDYGLVTVEAFASQKPVITCVDSGGPAELVIDHENGLVCEPAAESLALAMRTLMDDRDMAEQMGEVGHRQVSEMTWQRTLEKLVLV